MSDARGEIEVIQATREAPVERVVFCCHDDDNLGLSRTLVES